MSDPTKEPVYVDTIVPIGIDELKRQFTEKNIVYAINYEGSKLKGTPFLTYLSNVDMPCVVYLNNLEPSLELLKAYLNSVTLVNILQLEDLAMHVLLAAKGMQHGLSFDPSEFIAENREVVDKWISHLNSMSLYSLHCIKDPRFEEHVKSYPEDASADMSGSNYIHLTRHEQFAYFLSQVDESTLRYYSGHFNERLFKGHNLFHYWSHPDNSVYRVSILAVSEEFSSEKFKEAFSKDMAEIRKATDKEAPDVPSL